LLRLRNFCRIAKTEKLVICRIFLSYFCGVLSDCALFR
jgi:hypothetical protein